MKNSRYWKKNQKALWLPCFHLYPFDSKHVWDRISMVKNMFPVPIVPKFPFSYFIYFHLFPSIFHSLVPTYLVHRWLSLRIIYICIYFYWDNKTLITVLPKYPESKCSLWCFGKYHPNANSFVWKEKVQSFIDKKIHLTNSEGTRGMEVKLSYFNLRVSRS